MWDEGTSRLGPFAALGLLAFLSFPDAASATSSAHHSVSQALSEPGMITAAVAPSMIDPRANGRTFDQQLNEARVILGELRAFAERAEAAIQLGHRVKKARRTNAALKSALASNTTHRDRLASDVDHNDDRINHLAGRIVDNWLGTVSLDHQDAAQRQRLDAARQSWMDIEHRVVLARERLAELRAEARELRAERAAFAAEIGRTRRQLETLNRHMQATRSEQRNIEATEQRLRTSISAGLRALIWNQNALH
ncbi:MAG: hypothetical protein ACR2Q4_05730 [Geminicoccaceae bacterium]